MHNFDSHDFLSYVFTGGLNKTLEKLDKDLWHKAKRKAHKVVGLTILIYIPFSVLFCIVFSINQTIGILLLLLIYLSVPLYWKFIYNQVYDKEVKLVVLRIEAYNHDRRACRLLIYKLL